MYEFEIICKSLKLLWVFPFHTTSVWVTVVLIQLMMTYVKSSLLDLCRKLVAANIWTSVVGL